MENVFSKINELFSGNHFISFLFQPGLEQIIESLLRIF